MSSEDSDLSNVLTILQSYDVGTKPRILGDDGSCHNDCRSDVK